jgi:hypothetical protein
MYLSECRRVGLGCVYLYVDEWDWDVSTCVWTSGTGMCLPVCRRVVLGCVYLCVDKWD